MRIKVASKVEFQDVPVRSAKTSSESILELSPADRAELANMNREKRIGPDPDTVDYSSDDEFIRIFTSWENPSLVPA